MLNKKTRKTSYKNFHVFTVYTDIVEDNEIPVKDEDGNIVEYEVQRKYVKKDVKMKRTIYLGDIIGWGEYVNKKGKVLKTFSEIDHDTYGKIVVKERYENLNKLMNREEESFSVKGYKRYD